MAEGQRAPTPDIGGPFKNSARGGRGELVPTEAGLSKREGRAYEPAPVLLERIRREHERTTRVKLGEK